MDPVAKLQRAYIARNKPQRPRRFRQTERDRDIGNTRRSRMSGAGGEPILWAVLGGKAQDALVIGDERAAEFDRGRDQEPIRRIAVLEMMK
jgi:hypothetical protein